MLFLILTCVLFDFCFSQLDPTSPAPTYQVNSRRSGFSIFNGPDSRGVGIAWSRSVVGNVFMSPILDGRGILIAGFNNALGDVRAYNTSAAGASAWSFTAGGSGAIVGTPALGANGLLYHATGSRIVAMNLTDRTAATWVFATLYTFTGAVAIGGAALGGLVFVGDTSGTMYALDPLTGVQAWSFNTALYSTGGASIQGCAAVNDDSGVLYFFAGYYFWALHVGTELCFGDGQWAMWLPYQHLPSVKMASLSTSAEATMHCGALMRCQVLSGGALLRTAFARLRRLLDLTVCCMGELLGRKRGPVGDMWRTFT